MVNLRVVKVSYSEELPNESSQWLNHLIEGALIEKLNISPELKGQLLRALDNNKYRREIYDDKEKYNDR
ncbi:hypothetical protein [Pseudalkalibacillus sp. NRS-1564]|uniref:hypothetical protein n=1 Tax=Pseudalkalibacillus sp. NRS-1564 TaxID=3233900 RepID=UPI003D28BB28